MNALNLTVTHTLEIDYNLLHLTIISVSKSPKNVNIPAIDCYLMGLTDIDIIK
jgi:hypothetical protein